MNEFLLLDYPKSSITPVSLNVREGFFMHGPRHRHPAPWATVGEKFALGTPGIPENYLEQTTSH